MNSAPAFKKTAPLNGKRARACLAPWFAGLSLVLAGVASSMAQTTPAVQIAPGSTQSATPTRQVLPLAAQKSEAKPLWQELTHPQQHALKPLAANWATIGEAQKRKWLALSKNYPSLSPAEQQKMHGRMTEWVALSPQQRTEARLNFAEAKKLLPSEKTAHWEAYQALSAEEKQKLAATAPSKITGAAAPLKPVAPQKLATVPVTRHGNKSSPEIAATSPLAEQNASQGRPPVLPAPPAVKNN
jgi:hypothetical protein